MVTTNTQIKQFKYTQRDFDSVIGEINNYVKQYYPEWYGSFTDNNSFEKIVSEIVAMQSDVLHFYLNDSVKNLFQKYTNEPEAIYRNAKQRGYKIKTVSPAYGYGTISQLVPAMLSGSNYIPNLQNVVGNISSLVLSNNIGDVRYTNIGSIDMNLYDSYDVALQSDEIPTFFRIYKKIPIRSGNILEKVVIVDNTPESFRRILVDKNVAFIESIKDSEGNTWYEVDYLAQDFIFDSINNDGSILDFSSDIITNPYILKIRKVSRRFVTDHMSNGDCYVEFGAGKDIINDLLTEISAKDFISNENLANINIGLNPLADNFNNSDSFGLSPYNTTLTIRYVTSRGEIENAPSNTIDTINSITVQYPSTVSTQIQNSWQFINDEPVNGAQFYNNIDKIRLESQKIFMTQNRCVTENDYAIRAKMMPSKYGSISKVFVEKNSNFIQSTQTNSNEISNTLDMYILSRDKDGYLTPTSRLTKINLSTYLQKYKMVGVGINLIDANIINFGVYFEYICKIGYDKTAIFLELSNTIKEYFNPSKWEINQPINIEDLRYTLLSIDGVVSIPKLELEPKYRISEGYSGNYYDVSINNGFNVDSTLGLLLPPKDVGIFELKYPERNIRGRYV